MAGLRVGDIITQLNGTAVKNGVDFDVAVAHSKIGSQIRISYMRGAWVSEVAVTVGKINLARTAMLRHHLHAI